MIIDRFNGIVNVLSQSSDVISEFLFFQVRILSNLKATSVYLSSCLEGTPLRSQIRHLMELKLSRALLAIVLYNSVYILEVYNLWLVWDCDSSIGQMNLFSNPFWYEADKFSNGKDGISK